MKRRLFWSVTVLVMAGCQNAVPQVDPWAALGPRRIPPPATGSIGQTAASQPYYQSSPTSSGTSNTSGTVVSDSTVGTNQPTFTAAVSPPPVGNPVSLGSASTGASAVASAGQSSVSSSSVVDGWRPPADIVRSASIVSRPEPIDAVDPSGSAFPGNETVVSSSGPTVVTTPGSVMRIVEPARTVVAGSVLVQPMPINDATVAFQPAAPQVPGRLAQINNQPLATTSTPRMQFTAQLPGAAATGSAPSRSSATIWRAAPGGSDAANGIH